MMVKEAPMFHPIGGGNVYTNICIQILKSKLLTRVNKLTEIIHCTHQSKVKHQGTL